MAPEDFIDDPYLGEDKPEPLYEDGFGDDTFLGEADYGSRPKYAEKTRRAALRQGREKITSPSRQQVKHDRRHQRRILARRMAAQRALDLWRKRVRSIALDLWPRYHRSPVSNAVLAVMANAFVQRAVRIASEKADGPMDVDDAISIGARALIASAVTAAARRSGSVQPGREEAYTKAVFERLDLAEKVIKLIIKAGGTSEAEDIGETAADHWGEDEDEARSGSAEFESDPFEELDELAEDFEGLWEDEASRTTTGRPQRRPRPSGNERQQCSHALRQAARYLLRLERRLEKSGERR
jgi:hypothetical protein